MDRVDKLLPNIHLLVKYIPSLRSSSQIHLPSSHIPKSSTGPNLNLATQISFENSVAIDPILSNHHFKIPLPIWVLNCLLNTSLTKPVLPITPQTNFNRTESLSLLPKFAIRLHGFPKFHFFFHLLFNFGSTIILVFAL